MTKEPKKLSVEEVMKTDAVGEKISHSPTFSDAKKLEDVTKEYGGPRGKEPTRFGDWEQKGRCTDF
ncbi:MAG: DUF1674 domain-containing protein [Alphaproteobacteria bacterium]|nr:DUF1674 domain-containing protein [Rhodospirillales bacterium]MCW9046230.1 DUF1674 domain-containing protein [Alphaproteobacteria bacterium]